ncbi:MAG TPA: hypothetical protein VLH35_04735 [Candidatus Acidoferrales bacterium]|nr:hypothetical protein [Candidatus Acidoferrales bacterium]
MILTAGVIVMILVAMTYASDMLNTKMGENEFKTNQQFMQTAGQQIDDIAWTIGRTQTVSYSSRFGQINFEPAVLTYTVEVYHAASSTWETLPISIQTGIVLYNMPLSSYSIINGYFQRIPNDANNSFLLTGSSAAITQVFVTQKIPMTAGNYLRIVVVPTVRVLESVSASSTKIYIPELTNGTSHYNTQSLTMTGNGITKAVESGITKIRITATFPQAVSGFDSAFFNFNSVSETKNLSQSSLVELYVGELRVTIGNV